MELNETSTSAWTKTAIENVYIAKLAVVTSIPSIFTMHCSGARRSTDLTNMPEELVAPSSVARAWMQGVTWSEYKTARSRANCSSVTGRNEPGHKHQIADDEGSENTTPTNTTNSEDLSCDSI